MAISDDIKKFTLEINESKNNGETLANLKKLESETSNLRKENEQLEKVMAYLATTGKKGTDTYKQMEAQLKANRTAITQNSNEIKGLTKNLDLDYMSMGQLKKRSQELSSTLFVMSQKANPEEYARLEAQLKQVGGAMDKLKGKTDETKGFFGKLDGQLGKVGLSLPALGWGAAIAGAAAAGKAIVEFVDKTMESRRQIEQLTGASGQSLSDLTANITATSDTFKVGFEEMAVANNNFAKSMGISNDAAQQLIDQGFVNGANASGEFLAMLSEYGPQLKEAGYSAEEAIAMMSQQVKAGVFTDKGIDVIKEASLRLREMPQATQDALNGIGINSKQMMEQLSSGQITVSDAIKQVSQKMATLPPQSAAVGTAIADIFGGPGEDAGLAYITMLGDAAGGMEKLGEKSRSQMSTQELMLTANKELQQSLSDLVGVGTGGFDRIRSYAKLLVADGIEGIITGFKFVRDLFIDVYNNSIVLRGGLQYVFLILKDGFQVIMLPLKEAWNTAKGLLSAVGALLTGRIKDIPGIIKETITKSKDIAVDTMGKMANNVKDAWDNTLNGKISPPTIDPAKQADEAKKQKQAALEAAKASTDAAKKAKDEAAKKALDDLTKSQKTETAALKTAMMERGATKERIEATLQQKELEHLAARLALQKKYGQDTADTEQSIVDKQLKIREDFEKQRAEIDQAIVKAKEEADKSMADFDKEQEKEMLDGIAAEEQASQEKFARYEELRKTFQSTEKTDKETMLQEMADLEEAFKAGGILSQEEYERKKAELNATYTAKRIAKEQEYLNVASSALTGFSDLFTAMKDAELAKAGDNKEKQAAIEKKYAKKQQGIAIGQALISGALAAMEIWKTPTTLLSPFAEIYKGVMTGLMAGTTIANVAKIKSQQFAKGRYPVVGASDGQLYSSEFVGKPRTGIYNKPSLGLFSEKKPEAVIDGLTTDKLLWNYPHIWNGITTLAAGGVPQFADGRYPASTNSSTSQTVVVQQSDPELKSFLKTLIDNGVKAPPVHINALEIRDKQNSYDAAVSASEM